MSDARTGYVYTLSDPRTGSPRYVGATVAPQQRYRAHINNPHSDDLREWMDELHDEGVEPEMSLVRVTDDENLREEERRVLKRIAAEFDILNAWMSPAYSSPVPSDSGAANGDRLSEEIIVRCSPEWKRALRVRASQRGMDMSKHIREVLDEEMGGVESVLGDEAIESIGEGEHA